MKWAAEEYGKLKTMIFDLIRTQLKEKDSSKLTGKDVFDAIDEMFEKLTGIPKKEFSSTPVKNCYIQLTRDEMSEKLTKSQNDIE